MKFSNPNEPSSRGFSFGFTARLGLFFAAVFLVMGTQLPFLSIWLDWRGLTAAEISIISSAPLFVRLLATPAIAFAADRMGDHRAVLILLAWSGTILLFVLSTASGFWPIFTLVLLFSILWTTVMPLTETIAMAGVKTDGHDYGRMRLWGSLSFIFASFAGGFIVQHYGAGSIIWLLVAGACITILCSHALPRPKGLGRLKDATSGPTLKLNDALALVRSPVFLLFLFSAGLVQASHAVFYIYGSLHWRAQGLSTGWIGSLWAIGVIAEIGLFAFSRVVVRAVGALPLLLMGAVAGLIRWSIMALDPPIAMLVPVQILHGLTYGASHLGAIHFIGAAVDDAQAGTAQALYASITAGAAMGGAILIAGLLFTAVQGQAYWAMAALSLGSAVGCVVLIKLRDGPGRAQRL